MRLSEASSLSASSPSLIQNTTCIHTTDSIQFLCRPGAAAAAAAAAAEGSENTEMALLCCCHQVVRRELEQSLIEHGSAAAAGAPSYPQRVKGPDFFLSDPRVPIGEAASLSQAARSVRGSTCLI